MTAAELDTLPVGAVVLTYSGVAYKRLCNGLWCATTGRADQAWPASLMSPAEPFTLIYPLDLTERTEP